MHFLRSVPLFFFLALISAGPAKEPTMEAKTQALADQWKARLSEEKMNVLLAPPFVIAGNGTPAQLAGYRDNTIIAAQRALQAMYFDKKPTEPILILLFESEGPYKRLSKKWLDYENVPHYGYYRHGDHEHVMVMNVATGLGTLVHEETHALIAPDFPTVPSWFNEGLASLYEQSAINGKSIKGYENWRLPALQAAIKADKLRSFKDLAADANFYDSAHVGLNYGQARYLMFYLQQKGLMVRYYKTFRDNAADDPTGIKSLEKIIAPQKLEAFEKDWRDWVLTLKFG
ncbi:MAG TPA: DUF1570 domain-containing protein [Tepidisphaeraceae bacterium]|jgi:hypothetical protein|nr:DUF1570 domain-containing protein [Tepidisphaeraceae bacterium]